MMRVVPADAGILESSCMLRDRPDPCPHECKASGGIPGFLCPPPLDLSCKAVAQERLKGLEEEDGLSSGPPGIFVGQ